MPAKEHDIKARPFDSDLLVACSKCGPNIPLIIFSLGRRAMIICPKCERKTPLIAIGMALVADWEHINDSSMFLAKDSIIHEI